MSTRFEPGPRHPTRRAIEALTALLHLPPFGQDFDLECADATRVDEMLDLYRGGVLDDDQRFTLMSLAVASFDERLLRKPAQALDVGAGAALDALLRRDHALHFHTLAYWACLESDEPEEHFAVTPLVRRIWSDVTPPLVLALTEASPLAGDRVARAGSDVRDAALLRAAELAPRHVPVLLAGGAAASARDREGQTALHFALRHDDASALVALLDAGAALEAKDALLGATPLVLAGRFGSLAALDALLARGADASAQDANGYTALHGAVEHRRPEAVARLLREHLDLALATKNGETPHAIALRHGDHDLAVALEASDRR